MASAGEKGRASGLKFQENHVPPPAERNYAPRRAPRRCLRALLASGIIDVLVRAPSGPAVEQNAGRAVYVERIDAIMRMKRRACDTRTRTAEGCAMGKLKAVMDCRKSYVPVF